MSIRTQARTHGLNPHRCKAGYGADGRLSVPCQNLSGPAARRGRVNVTPPQAQNSSVEAINERLATLPNPPARAERCRTLRYRVEVAMAGHFENSAPLSRMLAFRKNKKDRP